jgi:hypothetical protein
MEIQHKKQKLESAISDIEKEIFLLQENLQKVSLQIDVVEACLSKPFEDWSDEEKRKYGDMQQLRDKEKQLRDKEKQLRDKEKQLRDEKKQLRDEKIQLVKKEERLFAQEQALLLEEKSNYKGNEIFKFSLKGDGWNYLSSLFTGISEIKETFHTVESDRQIKFNSKPLRLFHTDKIRLEIGNLPDLRFQDINLKTNIQKPVDEFMRGKDFLAVLIGPTGCGKTHELITRAKNEFTIFIDAQWNSTGNFCGDYSLNALKNMFENVTVDAKVRNENLPTLRTIAYAFILARMLFLKYLQEKYPKLTPTQFLIHQIINSDSIKTCFLYLRPLAYEHLIRIHKKLIQFTCLFCFDEAHVLLEHLGSQIITQKEGNNIQQNTDVNENSKRGTLSVLLYAINNGQFANKVIMAGTSSKLRNVENFGTVETKPTFPVTLNQFTAWDSQLALQYVTSFVDLDPTLFKHILSDNYRPRILENFVYDLFSIGNNDQDSPTTRAPRIEKLVNGFVDINDVLTESYNSVLHRFCRVTIEDIASSIKKYSHTEIMLKILLTSMVSMNQESIYCKLNPGQREFFTETIGSIYLNAGTGGYSFFEGYMIDSLLGLFEEELKTFKLDSFLELLRNIVITDGKKTTAKGTPFEAVVLADIIQQNGQTLKKILSDFGVIVPQLGDLRFPVQELKCNDQEIIETRPLDVLIRPSNQFRPDILAFLSKEICVSFGIKLYTSKIDYNVHQDNLESTDPDLFFVKKKRPTHKKNQTLWLKSIRDTPLKLIARFLIELPEPVHTVPTENIHENVNGKENIIILVTRHNMRKLLSEKVALLVEYITSN